MTKEDDKKRKEKKENEQNEQKEPEQRGTPSTPQVDVLVGSPTRQATLHSMR